MTISLVPLFCKVEITVATAASFAIFLDNPTVLLPSSSCNVLNLTNSLLSLNAFFSNIPKKPPVGSGAYSLILANIVFKSNPPKALCAISSGLNLFLKNVKFSSMTFTDSLKPSLLTNDLERLSIILLIEIIPS